MQREVVPAQLHAMDSEQFELGVFDPTAERAGEVVGSMLLRQVSKDQLVRSLGWLAHRNASGHHIYVRPAAPHALSLVDDLTRDDIRRMIAEGFEPSVVVETSPGNFQAWVHHGERLEPRLSTAVARRLAERFGGDAASADFRHFGRLAGYTNRKPKHRRDDGGYPFVRLHVACRRSYPQAASFVDAVEAALRESDAAEARRLASYRALPRAPAPSRAINSFWSDPKYGGDMTRADLAYATYSVARGVSVNDIEAAIASRDLSHKGSASRQAAYLTRTLKKAVRAALPHSTEESK
jgi:hypothetical protein